MEEKDQGRLEQKIDKVEGQVNALAVQGAVQQATTAGFKESIDKSIAAMNIGFDTRLTRLETSMERAMTVQKEELLAVVNDLKLAVSGLSIEGKDTRSSVLRIVYGAAAIVGAIGLVGTMVAIAIGVMKLLEAVAVRVPTR